jgi:hypothetical protein
MSCIFKSKSKKYIIVVLLLCWFLFVLGICGEKESKLIFSGVDTLNTLDFLDYFDFILQRPCTSQADYESQAFAEHLHFQWFDAGYELIVSDVNYPCMKDLGKINLDSIKVAPPDSDLVIDNGGGAYRVFDVTPDSLKSIIGTFYIIKTRVDPRYDRPFYTKIRIIDFDVIDSANHIVEMVFVWAMQFNGSKDLPTSNLDTFDIPVPIISNPKKNNFLSSNHFESQTVFKTTSNRFVIPEELVGRVKFAEVYDLRGRLLKGIEINRIQKHLDINLINNIGNMRIIEFIN